MLLRLLALLLVAMLSSLVQADDPLLPNAAQVEVLKAAGDRFADQSDYKAALEKYTEAYHGVVSRIRGQKFSTRVLPSMMNRQELKDELIRQMNKEYSESELKLADGAYKVFGLMPPDMAVLKLMTALLTEEVAGFYDPESKKMVLIIEQGSAKDPGWFGRLLGAKPAFDKDEQKTTLAHEMTHALQDQLYDLQAMNKRIEGDDDMLLAFSALVEGDATLLMFDEMDEEDITQADPEAMRATFNLMSWFLPVAGGKTFRSAPPIFRESLVFPYFSGMIFCLTLAGKGGWEAVDVAYQQPPTSTEQIMHPRKYQGEEFDAPQLVTIPDLKEAVGNEWQYLGGNCLGEMQTSIMLKSVRGGTRAAEGWDGDRYEVFQTEQGKLAVVSVSVWDSPEDAEEFASAYRVYRTPPEVPQIPKQVDAAQQNEDKAAESTIEKDSVDKVFIADAQRVVEVNGDKVWILDGFSAKISDAVRARMSESTYQEKVFPESESKTKEIAPNDKP